MAQPPKNCNQLQNCRRKRWPKKKRIKKDKKKKEKYSKNFISPGGKIETGKDCGNFLVG